MATTFVAQTNYHSGLAAEDSVADHYVRIGADIAARRWRGRAGEVDLIAQQGDDLVFVEVKKSRSHSHAARRISQRQMERIYAAAGEYLAASGRDQNTNVRFDVALLDQHGAIDIIENAFGSF